MKNRVVLLLAAALALSGCSTIDKQAFDRSKTYAVVSTYTDRVKVPDPNVIMLDKEKFIAALRADDVVHDFTMNFIRGYATQMPVKISHGKSVTDKPAYKKAGLPPQLSIRGMEFVAPKGYGVHFDSDQTKITQLIRDLGADGGIVIYHHPAVMPTSHKGYITTVAVAYDKNGVKVLQYTNNHSFPITKHIGPGDKRADKSLDIAGVKHSLVVHAETAGKEFAQLFKSMLGG